jgi:signal transduction histidine kinase
MPSLNQEADMTRRSKTGSKTSKLRARKPPQARGLKTASTKRRVAPETKRRKRLSFSDLQEQSDRYFDELKEAREQQAATAEILKVINSSQGNLVSVFDAILEKAMRLCDARIGGLFLPDGELARYVAMRNPPAQYAELLTRQPPQMSDLLGRNFVNRPFLHIVDVSAEKPYLVRDPIAVAAVELGGIRTIVSVPLRKDDGLVGVFTVYRQEVRPFTAKQIALLQSFAVQAVTAIENARLFNEGQARTRELAQSLDDLRTMQNRLVQTEKLASLGQLTAGIAHEIKNPLNFVNNFSALAAELVDELNDILKPAPLDEKIRSDVSELTKMLKSNLEKVTHHGKRADSIVKNMLLHSREGSAERRSADINALVEESLNLAYHGARAEKPQFNVTLQRDFDPQAGQVEVFPQEITRVLLNLISNGFYAVTKRKADNGAAEFEPQVTATTSARDDRVEIRIRDNGTGIPPEVREKIFNPFFTTKPAGEGTGLGLSMSHDIIVKQHGGTIDVETEPGVFTEFTITLPRGNGDAVSKFG